MAEVEQMSAAAAADIPVTSGGSDVTAGNIELGTSPTQEPSSNSHAHDSEYDTASDLEGGEEYDDDDDDMDDDGESLSEEDEDDDDDDDDELDDDEKGSRDISTDKVEQPKKVDEDRSNPQYIPKRGTFYEHDDRTAECEGDAPNAPGDASSVQESVGGSGGPNNSSRSPQSNPISQASRTMKRWQPASGVDRWSHDRFDADEQAPKSRQELVTAYGYDIRTEEAPPRARRRRRYGRGPSKYSRNWEDENAYLKASNKDRKVPRPADFPALNERVVKVRKAPRGTREEKENRIEKRLSVGTSAGTSSEKSLGPIVSSPRPEKHDDRERERDRNDRYKDKSSKVTNNYSRQNAPVGRQPAMEFKQKHRNGHNNQQSPVPNHNSPSSRLEKAQYERERPANRTQATPNNVAANEQPQKPGNRGGQLQHANQSPQPMQRDTYNNNSASNNKPHEQPYQHMPQPAQQQQQPLQQPQAQQQQQTLPMRQPPPQRATPPSNISQRLQVQNRNDPSHVGSVQMHAIATQNQQLVSQQQQQQQHQQAPNMILPQQQQQQQPQQLPQEQRGPPKRYSSQRRTQLDAQHLAEQHQLQQLHMQQQQQQPLILPEQHLLPLMQLYHQENLQAQMQAMQVGAAPAQPKQPTYSSVPPGAQPPSQPYGPSAGNPAPPAAYFVATPDAYAATSPPTGPPPQSAPYAQPPPNFMPPAQAPPATATTLAYASGGPQAVPGAPPAAYGPPAAPPVSGPPPSTATNSNPNFTNYQNYNTVGGTTYFVPPAQATTRPVMLPQRRPTNAIPILPPSEKKAQQQRAAESKEEAKQAANAQSNAPIGSAENIDHILDNMFVQRPAYQPQVAVARKSSSPPSTENSTTNNTAEQSASAEATPPPDDAAVVKTNAEQSTVAASNSAEPAASASEDSSSVSTVAVQE